MEWEEGKLWVVSQLRGICLSLAKAKPVSWKESKK